MKLVVFDLDGTLIDSRRDLADSVNAMLADYGAPGLALEAITAMVGEGAAVLVRRALTASGLDPTTPDALARFLSHYDSRLTAHTSPYEGMVAALEALRSEKLTLAVLTNKPTRASNVILDRLGLLPFFSQVIGGDTPLGRKPDPAGLLRLVTSAAAAPATSVLVGDSPIDVSTARAAGACVCFARYGFGAHEPIQLEPGELAVDLPSAIPAAIRSFQPGTSGARLQGTARSRT